MMATEEPVSKPDKSDSVVGESEDLEEISLVIPLEEKSIQEKITSDKSGELITVISTSTEESTKVDIVASAVASSAISESKDCDVSDNIESAETVTVTQMAQTVAGLAAQPMATIAAQIGANMPTLTIPNVPITLTTTDGQAVTLAPQQYQFLLQQQYLNFLQLQQSLLLSQQSQVRTTLLRS